LELDLFGRIRRSVEAAGADLAASEQDRGNVLVAMLADIGSSYANLRGDQLRLEIARKNIAIARDTLELTRQRVKAGLATERDTARAEAQLEVVRAQVPAINTSIQLGIHRLGVLLGEQPGALEEELATKAPIPPTPPQVPTGVPSDLLQRRPDIQRASDGFIKKNPGGSKMHVEIRASALRLIAAKSTRPTAGWARKFFRRSGK
jgi:outer membrane protein TolC